jgi:hypothetical protein
MKDGDVIDDEFLRNLDDRGMDGNHTLIVTTSPFGMRGVDYRSSKGITLIIAASFANQRQAMQGLNRVGRFGDPCKRYIAKGVDLVDLDQNRSYIASLNQFLSKNQKYVITAKLSIPQVEKKGRSNTNTAINTTTNTARSTPTRTSRGQSSMDSLFPPKTKTSTELKSKDLNKRQTQLLAGG